MNCLNCKTRMENTKGEVWFKGKIKLNEKLRKEERKVNNGER